MVAENFVAVGSGVATIAAAVLVSYQIILLKRQETQEYFSDFNARYDQIITRVPLRVLIDGASLEDAILESHNKTELKLSIERAVFDYFQLCEEQVTLFLSKRGTDTKLMSDISLKTSFNGGFRDSNSWKKAFKEWASGMENNLKIPAVNALYWSFRERAESAELPVPFKNFHQHFVEKSSDA
jgi:hypothetical protein